MYSSPTRMRAEREAGRRGNAAVVVSTLLSLAVVGVAVAVVAYLVLRTPSSAVDSAERLDPVGTAIAAPTEPPSLPTPIPTAAPEPTALGFTGEAPEADVLPTVPAPAEQPQVQVSGPTPTPRVVALPTAAPAVQPTLPAPVATLPPVPIEQVPVVALQPVEAAPPPAPTAAANIVSQPTPAASTVIDDDPFDIFEENEIPRIIPAQNDALERVSEIQDENRARAANADGNQPLVVPAENDRGADVVRMPTIVVPVIEPSTDNGPIVRNDDGTVEIVMPDVDATVAAITARAIDPNRNPNVTDPGSASGGRSASNRDDERREPGASSGSKRKESSRDRNRRTPTPVAGSGRDDANDDNANGRKNGRDQEECENIFADLPENQRPANWRSFDKC